MVYHRPLSFPLPLASFIATLVLLPAAGHASEATALARMQAQLDALSRQVGELNARVAEQDAVIAAQNNLLAQSAPVVAAPHAAQAQDRAAVAAAPVTSGAGTPVTVTMAERLKIESADGLYSFEPFGRLHMDSVTFLDDKADRANNAHLRRARLGFRGKLGEDLGYRMEMDFAGEAANIRDAYLSYNLLDVAALYAGNMKPPAGLEQNTSSNDIAFAERTAVTNAFTRGHVLGAAIGTGGKNWSFKTGVYNEDASVNTGADDEAVSVEARASADLLPSSPHVLHAGLGGSWRKPNSATNAVTIAAAPAGTGPLNIVSTGAIAGVDRMGVYGAELAGVFGPWSFQSEYMLSDVARSGAPTARFDGYYAQTGWIFTGESRPYDGKSGLFGRIKPETPFSLRQGGWGAFEILARYDTLSLDDAGAGIAGGEVDQYGLGLNWYMRDNLRMMANYTSVDSNGTAVVAGDDPDVVHLRAQVDF